MTAALNQATAGAQQLSAYELTDRDITEARHHVDVILTQGRTVAALRKGRRWQLAAGWWGGAIALHLAVGDWYSAARCVALASYCWDQSEQVI